MDTWPLGLELPGTARFRLGMDAGRAWEVARPQHVGHVGCLWNGAAQGITTVGAGPGLV